MIVDFQRHEVRLDGREVSLTKREWQLLAVLTKKPGHLVTHDAIFAEFYGDAAEDIETRGVSQHMARLRRKIGPEKIKTEPSFGFKFVGRVRVR